MRIVVLEVSTAGEVLLGGLEDAGLVKVRASWEPGSENGHHAPLMASVGAMNLASTLTEELPPALPGLADEPVAVIRPIEGLEASPVPTLRLPICNLCMGEKNVPVPGGAEDSREECPRCHGAGVADPEVCCGDRCACH